MGTYKHKSNMDEGEEEEKRGIKKMRVLHMSI